MDPNHKPDYDECLASLLDGTLTQQQGQLLEQRLANDPSMRQRYYEYVKIHTLLRQELTGRDSGDVSPDIIGMLTEDLDDTSQNDKTDRPNRVALSDKRTPATHSAQPPSSGAMPPIIGRIARYFAIAAVLTLMATIVFWTSQSIRSQYHNIASVTGSLNASWDTGFGKGNRNTASLTAGELFLRAGHLELTFNDGTVATLDAPSQVTLISDNHLRLSRGRVYVIAPTGQSGFRVSTPGALVVDLGTEFGVSYLHDLATEVHVFKGEVNFSTHYPDASNRASHDPVGIKAGFAGRASQDSESIQDLRADASQFNRNIESVARAKPATVATHDSWLAYRNRLRTDPDMIACYDFNRQEISPRTLLNIASVTAPHLNGTLGDNVTTSTAPRWAAGRFPGTQALLFSPAEKQYVALPQDDMFMIDGDLTAIWWMKPRKTFNRGYSMIVIGCGSSGGDSDDERESDNHMYAYGIKKGRVRAFHESGKGIDEEFLSSSSVSPNRWTQVVITRDSSTKTYRVYINGVLSDSKSYADNVSGGRSPDSGVAIGRSGGAKLNHFDGKLDDLMVYSRTLTGLEIAEIYRQSNPGIK